MSYCSLEINSSSRCLFITNPLFYYYKLSKVSDHPFSYIFWDKVDNFFKRKLFFNITFLGPETAKAINTQSITLNLNQALLRDSFTATINTTNINN